MLGTDLLVLNIRNFEVVEKWLKAALTLRKNAAFPILEHVLVNSNLLRILNFYVVIFVKCFSPLLVYRDLLDNPFLITMLTIFSTTREKFLSVCV